MTEEHKHALAIVIGFITMVCGVVIIGNNTHSIVNWIGGLAVLLGGVLLEEKYLLRRR